MSLDWSLNELQVPSNVLDWSLNELHVPNNVPRLVFKGIAGS